MAKFRKKPVVIEAILTKEAMQRAAFDWNGLPQWFRDTYEKGGVVFGIGGVSLPTLEGTMIARPDDWIICGVGGELYPCKPDIFAATYEPVED